jgi:hypothetical protein
LDRLAQAEAVIAQYKEGDDEDDDNHDDAAISVAIPLSITFFFKFLKIMYVHKK